MVVQAAKSESLAATVPIAHRRPAKSAGPVKPAIIALI
jgi:hypothetical protein